MVARGAGIERRGGRIVDVLVLANAYAAGKSQVQSVSLVGANTPSVTYAYDGNGNVVTRTATDPALSLTIGYDIDNHALTIRRPASGTGQATDNGSTFRYGPDGQRYFQELRQPGQSSRQLIYLGKDYEKEYTGAGQVERWYLPGGAVRIRSTDPAVASGTYFIHGDRLGSTSVMTDRNGQVVGEERRAFDAFGRPRAWDNWNVTEGANATPARNTTLFGPRNRRGFTQHEHVDRTNIIHMNGRIFDAELGRFYGVDPFIQFPSNSQSLNPYSYVLNNPMAGADPTGYSVVADRLMTLIGGGSRAMPNGFGPWVALGNGSSDADSFAPTTPTRNKLKPWEQSGFEKAAMDSTPRGPTVEVIHRITDQDRAQWERDRFEALRDYMNRQARLDELMLDYKNTFARNTLMVPPIMFVCGCDPTHVNAAGDDSIESVTMIEPVALGARPGRMRGVARAGASAEAALAASDARAIGDLITMRSELGLEAGAGTVARLDVGTRSFYGVNAHGTEITLRVNPISRTHAEADVFQQAANSGARRETATLYVDRSLCTACGRNGAVSSMARQLGIHELRVVSPNGVQVLRQ